MAQAADRSKAENSDTRRRIVLTLILTFLGLAAANPAAAQTAGKTYHIGWLGYATPNRPALRALDDAFLQVLRENGFVEGRNVAIEWRYVDGHAERNAQFAAEFVAMKVDVIVALGSAAARAARDATRAIPIVMFGAANPERTGLVASLARPGGNPTGMSNIAFDLGGKRLQAVKEVLPHVTRAGIVWDPGNPGSAFGFKNSQARTQAMGWTVISMPVQVAADLDAAFDTALREHAEVLFLHGTAISNFPRIAKFAAEHRIPKIGQYRSMAEHGALMSLGPDSLDQTRRTGLHVARILRGANPAEPPVEQPTKVYVAVNLKTAKTLGVTTPPTLLLRADRVIE